MQTAMLHTRVDEELKANATAVLESMGLSVSDAIRLFLRRIVNDQAFPLELKVPNAKTREAMLEADEIIKSRQTRLNTADELIADLETAIQKHLEKAV
jgi:DNA-damage-inducible protein J